MSATEIVDVWEQHIGAELFAKDVDATMATMAENPYVNHVPTMTGGVGATELRRFYAHHFITVNPDDMDVIPISRTIGEDRIVEEMVITFTHSKRMDYFLPGVPPTHRKIKVPTVVIAQFTSGKLSHEHIYWDQASVLVQAGLLEAEGLPVAGVAVADKVLDPQLPSNQLMFHEWVENE